MGGGALGIGLWDARGVSARRLSCGLLRGGFGCEGGLLFDLIFI